jgi:hypothetical protein
MYEAVREAHRIAENDKATHDVLINGVLEAQQAQYDACRKSKSTAHVPQDPTLNNANAQPTTTAMITNPPGNTGPSNPPAQPKDTIFSGIKIANAYQIIPEYNALKWPSTHERSLMMERVPVTTLRVGYVLPILNFTGPESYESLTEPDAYYVITTEYHDNSTRLSLAFRNPFSARPLPPCLTFATRSEPYSVVTMADAAIRGNILDPHVMTALKALGVPLLAPDTPMAHRHLSASGPNTHHGGRDSQLKADKVFLPLRIAMHNDRTKVQRILQFALEPKLNDPAIATAIRNMQTSSALQGIPALHPDNIPHLLSFNWTFDPEYSGTTKKPDAIHIAMFLKGRPGEVRTVRDLDDVRDIGDTMKLTYTTFTMEDPDADFPFYDRLITRTIDKVLRPGEGRSVRHLHIDFLTRQLNKLFTEWAHYSRQRNT